MPFIASIHLEIVYAISEILHNFGKRLIAEDYINNLQDFQKVII